MKIIKNLKRLSESERFDNLFLVLFVLRCIIQIEGGEGI